MMTITKVILAIISGPNETTDTAITTLTVTSIILAITFCTNGTAAAITTLTVTSNILAITSCTNKTIATAITIPLFRNFITFSIQSLIQLLLLLALFLQVTAVITIISSHGIITTVYLTLKLSF